ncbi:MBL fold metallo-hydrolase [Effusibacillus dendaii]|uniref:Hydrolase n=1 Tax=Effusibacillus dendaii TaxID=2743772 RepID=A0A7I8D7P2_9BACL|nr:MBL fold metallo-hydrolase [Effusibacillus dendaii]BCJ86124.1 hydrolase [Effusibacillus dendaii]
MGKAQLMTKIENVHKLVIPTPFPVGPVNVYVVEGDAVTLVDAGPKTEDAWQAFESQLKQAGFSLADIDQVVLTHHHVDHCGLLDRILEQKDLPIYGHPLAVPWVAQEEEFFRKHREYFEELYRRMDVEEHLIVRLEHQQKMINRVSCRVRLTDTFREGELIPGLEEWHVYETPGHAQSHIGLFRESDGVLIGGDHIIKHVSSNAIVEPPASPGEERPKTLLQYRESLLKCKALPITTVFSGHGEEVFDVADLVDIRLQQQDERAAKIRSWLLEEPLTPFAICKRLFPRAYEKELGLTMSEVIGHLDLLLERGQAVAEEQDGVIWYLAR